MTARPRHVYQFGSFRLDAGNRLLYRDGEVVTLAPKAVDTLLLLVTRSGEVLTKDEMLKCLWPDTFVEEGTLAQYVSLLRKALGDSASWIENHPRRGYRFIAPVEKIESSAAEVQIEEHTRTRTVVEEVVIPEKRRVRFPPAVWMGLALLSVVAASAIVWKSGRGKPSTSLTSLAVLPFRTVSDSPNEYLADGMTEALITRLTSLKALRVVSYSRVRRFKGTSEEAAAIGRQLGVQAVIEGSVRANSERLRISIHAVDTATGYTMWAVDRVEAQPDRLLDLEGQLAETAAVQVRGQLSQAERSLLTRSRTSSAEAFDLVLRARRESPEDAVPMLQRAIQLDSRFADAYGWLALAEVQSPNVDYFERQTLRKAISNVNQALSIDPNASIAIRALAHIHHEEGREVESLLMARRALESNPEDLDAIAAAAEAYFRTDSTTAPSLCMKKRSPESPRAVTFAVR